MLFHNLQPDFHSLVYLIRSGWYASTQQLPSFQIDIEIRRPPRRIWPSKPDTHALKEGICRAIVHVALDTIVDGGVGVRDRVCVDVATETGFRLYNNYARIKIFAEADCGIDS